MANATCLMTIMPTITAVAVPAASGFEQKNRSIVMPVMLPAVANMAHLRLFAIHITPCGVRWNMPEPLRRVISEQLRGMELIADADILFR
jgi:hypothetical protein